MTPETQKLLNLARQLGVTVQRTDKLDHNQAGAWRPDENRIYIANKLDPEEAVQTLAHEIGHVILDQDTAQNCEGEHYADRIGQTILKAYRASTEA